jgi:hypothetical protein
MSEKSFCFFGTAHVVKNELIEGSSEKENTVFLELK